MREFSTLLFITGAFLILTGLTTQVSGKPTTPLGLPTVKVDGLRVTDAESLAVSQMVLSGHANKTLVVVHDQGGGSASFKISDPIVNDCWLSQVNPQK